MKRFLGKLIRTALVLAAALAAGLVLTAAIFTDEIKLKNVDAPFIDLDVMVEDLAVSDSPGDEAVTETQAEDTISEFVISIRETEIRFNGAEISSNNFKSIFDAVHRNNVPVRLIDDYAEYYTYKGVLEYLKEKGIKPAEERLEERR